MCSSGFKFSGFLNYIYRYVRRTVFKNEMYFLRITILLLLSGLSLEREERIIGGRKAKAKQFPYQVGIAIIFPSGNFFCGGSIVSPKYILSAAHCAIK